MNWKRLHYLWGLTAVATLTLFLLITLLTARSGMAAAANNQTQGAPTPTDTLLLEPLGTYDSGVSGESAAEIVTHDPETQRLFVVNAHAPTIDVLDVSNPLTPTLEFTIAITPYGGGVNSIEFYRYDATTGILAAAVQADPAQDPGLIVFFDANGGYLQQVSAGALPDMVTFSHDGNYVLAANEGEPDDDYLVDPEGSVTIVDMSGGVAAATAVNADFTAFNGREEELRQRGIRIYGPNASAAQDLEPEYIAVSPDNTIAFVTLQENNAFAVIDIATATVEDVLPLGYKDHLRGEPLLTQYPFTNLPVLGMTPMSQTIYLGGFSGLWYEGINSGNGHMQFVTLPDRGPNGATTNGNRPFVLPDYQARVVRFELTPAGELTITEQIMLTREDGVTPITGLPNIPGVDETPVDLFLDPLPYDPFGADLEGIVVAPNGHFWMVDEYRPAIYHFDADGVLVARLVPEGTAVMGGGTPGDYGNETLPAVYSSRRANRGFEAVALNADDGLLYAFIQSPLANPDVPTSTNSQVIRILAVDTTTGDPVAEYVYLLEGVDYRDSVVDKIGDAVYAGNGRFFVIERDSSSESFGKKFIFEIDLKGATNVLTFTTPTMGMPGVTSLLGGTLEQQTPDDLLALGIQPVFKRKVTNLPSLGYLAGDKPEGLALLPDGRLAVLNDNDFGLLDEPIAGDGTAPLNPNPGMPTLGIIPFDGGNMLDASDRDDGINLQSWPTLGMYQPDSVAAYHVGTNTFYITANEGDARDYDGFSEDNRMSDLAVDDSVLLGTMFTSTAILLANENMGRLKTSDQFGDLDGDGDFDVLYSYGARSFTIWDEFGNLVFDGGADFEEITAVLAPDIFNSNGLTDTFDSRSDDKGPEPEALTLGEIHGRTYAFIGFERTGGIIVYDITNPHQPIFVSYQRLPETDLAPEGLHFISAANSPTGQPLLAVANEESGTTTLYGLTHFSTLYLPLISKP
jgi:DNA-binding beta-propeller fold protein YncE